MILVFMGGIGMRALWVYVMVLACGLDDLMKIALL